MVDIDREINMNLKETELCLGLPGGRGAETTKNSMKRGYSDAITDLKLNLISEEIDETDPAENFKKEKNLLPCVNDPAKPPAAKAQVVGWPPVRSFRKNMAQKKSKPEESEKVTFGASFVKVSMDGAPYLRKVDLKMYQSYQELIDALRKMFSSFTIEGNSCGSQGLKDDGKLMDLLGGSKYLPTYEDKDGDWMLVGDVPWEMFVASCKRLRIMKGSEAIGLAPRGVEKGKNRS